MGGIIVGEEYLIKINNKWYKIKNSHAKQADEFFADNPNPNKSELPWYIEFINKESDVTKTN